MTHSSGLILALAIAMYYLPATAALSQIPMALENPGFEHPPLSETNSWSPNAPGWEQVGSSGITYEVPWADPSPAQEGSQYLYADSIGATIQQEFGVVEAGRRYIFTIRVFALEDSEENSIEAAFDVFQPVDGLPNDAFLRTSYSVYNVPWYGWIKDFDLAPQVWTEVQVILDSDDYPHLIGNRARVRLTGNHYAADDARLVYYEAGEYPEATNRTYHVSASTGDDSNDGLTPETAWRTFINPNAMILSPGDRVLLHRGDHWHDELNLRGWGRPDAPIELASFGPADLDRPRISRQDVEFDRCIVIQRPSNWVIREMDVRHAKLGIFLRYHNAYNNENVVIDDCNFEDMPDKTLAPEMHGYELAFSNGIWVGGHIWNDQMYDATVLDGLTITNSVAREVPHLFSSAFYFPPPNRNRLRNVHMADCLAVDCDNGAISVIGVSDMLVERTISIRGGVDNWAGSTLGMIQNAANVVIDNNEFGFIDRRKSGDGVGFDFEGDCIDCTFSNNVVHGASGSGLLILSTMGANQNLLVEGNVFYDNAWNPWNNEIHTEISVGANQNTGIIRNNGFYRRDERTEFYSPLSMGFQKINNRETEFEPVLLNAWWDFIDIHDEAIWSTQPSVGHAIRSPQTWINSHLQPYLWVRMRHTSGDEMEVRFITEPDPEWNGSKSLTVPIVPDGVLRDYWIDMREAPDWMTVITQVELEIPEAASDDVEFESIRFTGSLDPDQQPPIINTIMPESMTFYSEAEFDGSILESSEGSGAGGSVDSAATNFRFGDDAANSRYRGFFSFDTSPIPSDAVISSAQVGFTRQSIVGHEPWTFGQGLVDGDFAYLDLAVPHFGSGPELEPSDWQAEPTLTNVGRFVVPYKNGLTTMDLLNPEALPVINRNGRTQLRLYMSRGTNFDNSPDYITIGTGAAIGRNRPFMRVEYYIGSPPEATPPPEPPDPWIDLLTIPRPPLDLAVSDRGSDWITWTWVDNSEQEEEFLLYLAPGMSPPPQPTASRPADSSSATVENLRPNTYHTLEVSAANIRGESGRTAAVTALTHAEIPERPRLLGTAETSISIEVDIGANPGDTEFSIQVIGEDKWWLTKDGELSLVEEWITGAGPFTATNLSPGSEFRFQVKARNRELEETSFGPALTAGTDGEHLGDRHEVWHIY